MSFALCVGCARTVTQIVTYGDQMVVEVALRGTLEASANRYFMVFSRNAGYRVPLPPPDNISYELLEPGTEPRLGAAADYYANFYASWEGYVMVEPGGFFTVRGPFVQGQTPTRESLAGLGEASDKIQFTFRLSRIFGDSIPSTIYFDFVSVPWPIDSFKLPADHLLSTNSYISNAKIKGSTVTVSDEDNTSLDPALDIRSCTVLIQ